MRDQTIDAQTRRRLRCGLGALVGAITLACVVYGRALPSAAASRPPTLQEGARDRIHAHDNTNFPLVGRHRTVECGDCHFDGVMEGTPTTCEACHWVRKQDDRYRLELGAHCGDCHTPQSWKHLIGGAFDHEIETGFRLEGAHQVVDCAQCHRESFAATTTECSACHLADHQSAKDPDHRAAGFPTQCELCHRSSTSWSGAVLFDHSSFALSGRHGSAECAQCHTGGRFAGTTSSCADCHTADYNRATNPNHVAAAFPTDCESCHGSSAVTWRGATNFNHDLAFPLRGKHRTSQCVDCHRDERYSETSSDCMACHADDYNRTTNPNHLQAGFPIQCESCHGASANGWAGTSFDHDIRFRLEGKHRVAECADCHRNNVFAGTPSDCASCHIDDYNRTDHQKQGFSTDCESCHGRSATDWRGASFNHNRFPLRGRHATADCSQCHATGQYAGLPSQCASCHLDDYNRTTSPNHRELAFSTDCESCHGSGAVSWQGASFDHSRVFPLQGAHRNLDCQRCHNQGSNPPRDCFGCHAAAYQAARNPDHVSAGFPSSCEQCHYPSHTSWSQAVFNHSFPIDRGPHRFDCTECHRSSNYRVFSCIHCHEHEKSRMDDKHKEITGYVWDSQVCYSCHPDGRH